MCRPRAASRSQSEFHKYSPVCPAQRLLFALGKSSRCPSTCSWAGHRPWRRCRSGLLVHGVGVRFHQQATVRRLNGVFVAVILGNTVHHRFPDLRCNGGHGVGCFGPIVKVTGHSHTHGVGGPHAKSVGAFFYFMNTEETVCFIVFALVEEVDRQLIFFFKLFILSSPFSVRL